MTGWEILIGLLGAVVGGGGAAALLKALPEGRKADAEAELELQRAAAEAIGNMRSTARAARDEARRAHQDAEAARVEVRAAHAEVQQMRAELLQARREMADLRNQGAAERQALLEELAAERGRTAAAQQQVRQLQAALSNGSPGSGMFDGLR